mmetsp:Transcript_10821/g.21492  ORF Transcript_10821/g.21492 Transcript_10821/m.21492 type:complete len:93 (+) Transcript_10821:267-545(+)
MRDCKLGISAIRRFRPPKICGCTKARGAARAEVVDSRDDDGAAVAVARCENSSAAEMTTARHASGFHKRGLDIVVFRRLLTVLTISPGLLSH